ncbi:hypothetical protein FHS85_001632 [Rhodoligotrophos appendicifer]|uniref:hypothetical protein n=1 Tax=Rhodoligotrophos appendicifer TaxID=987056 RepID=UPI0014792CEF|nr:hypothetical protein [Rhodoligotrophos appendicifer]
MNGAPDEIFEWDGMPGDDDLSELELLMNALTRPDDRAVANDDHPEAGGFHS